MTFTTTLPITDGSLNISITDGRFSCTDHTDKALQLTQHALQTLRTLRDLDSLSTHLKATVTEDGTVTLKSISLTNSPREDEEEPAPAEATHRRTSPVNTLAAAPTTSPATPALPPSNAAQANLALRTISPIEANETAHSQPTFSAVEATSQPAAPAAQRKSPSQPNTPRVAAEENQNSAAPAASTIAESNRSPRSTPPDQTPPAAAPAASTIAESNRSPRSTSPIQAPPSAAPAASTTQAQNQGWAAGTLRALDRAASWIESWFKR